MKRKATTITEEFDKDGKITSKTTETIEEEDNEYIYPQYQYYPWPTTTAVPMTVDVPYCTDSIKGQPQEGAKRRWGRASE